MPGAGARLHRADDGHQGVDAAAIRERVRTLQAAWAEGEEWADAPDG